MPGVPGRDAVADLLEVLVLVLDRVACPDCASTLTVVWDHIDVRITVTHSVESCPTARAQADADRS